MNLGKWTRVLLLAIPLIAGCFVTGCAGFWQNPTSISSGDFALSNSANISVSPGSSGASTITVTPANSFTGTVDLTCAITSSPSGATSPATCGLSPTSVSITSTAAATATLTATTTSSTTTGTYTITVTGTSGSTSETTTLCAAVSTSSATCTPTAAASGVFYVLNQTTSQLVTLSISSSGALNTINTTALPAQPLAIAVAPNARFLYVSTLGGIFVYGIQSSGVPTISNGSQAIVQDPATTMQVDSTNSWLVEAISGSNQLFAININSSTGVLASAGEAEQPFSLPAATPQQLAISPGDSSTCSSCYIFVALGSGGTEMVHFNPGSSSPFGVAYQLGLKNSSGGANTIAVDPNNRLLYIGETNALPSATQTAGLRVLTITSSGATEISGSPYNIGGTGPTSILPSSDGNFVYVASRSVSGSANGAIASFSVSTSALTSVGTIQAGPSGLLSLAEDNTGTYLLATDLAGNPDLQAFTMSSGTLTSVLTSNTGTDPVGATAIAALPSQ